MIVVKAFNTVTSFTVPVPFADLSTAEERLAFTRRLMIAHVFNPLPPHSVELAQDPTAVEEVAMEVDRVAIRSSSEEVSQHGISSTPGASGTAGSSSMPGPSGTTRVRTSDEDDSDSGGPNQEPGAGEYGELLDPNAPSTSWKSIQRQRRKYSRLALLFSMSPAHCKVF